jgi:hypothetical protein
MGAFSLRFPEILLNACELLGICLVDAKRVDQIISACGGGEVTLFILSNKTTLRS